MILSVQGVRKSLGGRIAVDEVAFSLEAGEIVGVAGPNGSGKSTLINLIAGALEPDFGEIKLLGLDMVTQRARAQERLGYVPQGAPLPDDGAPARLLRRTARQRGIRSDADVRHAVLAAAQAAQLDTAFDRPLPSLSPGQRRRLALAAALVHSPVLLLLDEFDEGLDWQERKALRGIVKGAAEHRAVLLASRSLEELEAVCDRVILLHRGRIVGERTPGSDEDAAEPYAMIAARRRMER